MNKVRAHVLLMAVGFTVVVGLGFHQRHTRNELFKSSLGETEARIISNDEGSWRFSYVVDGRQYQETSWGHPPYKTGDVVPAEYVLERPEIARLKGLRPAPASLFGLGLAAFFALLFWIGGLFGKAAATEDGENVTATKSLWDKKSVSQR